MQPDQRLHRIARGRTDLVTDILQSQAVGPWPQVEGASLLQWAAYYGDVSALRLLVDRGEALASLGADLGLVAASFHGHWQLCEYLLEQGAPCDGCDPATGETALHAALTNEDRTRYDLVLKVLLQAGADVNAATQAGVPTHALMRDARTRGEAPLHRAAAFGTPETLQLLLDAGARPTQVDAQGDTPLAWASWYRRPPAVLRLLLYGEHRIHPAYRPLRENLLGSPAGPDAT